MTPDSQCRDDRADAIAGLILHLLWPLTLSIGALIIACRYVEWRMK